MELDHVLVFLAFSLSFSLALVTIVIGYYVVVVSLTKNNHKDNQEVAKVTNKALEVLREALGTLTGFWFHR